MRIVAATNQDLTTAIAELRRVTVSGARQRSCSQSMSKTPGATMTWPLLIMPSATSAVVASAQGTAGPPRR